MTTTPTTPDLPATESTSGSVWKRWLKRFGVAGFLFFFIKGLAWLIVPAVLASGIIAL